MHPQLLCYKRSQTLHGRPTMNQPKVSIARKLIFVVVVSLSWFFSIDPYLISCVLIGPDGYTGVRIMTGLQELALVPAKVAVILMILPFVALDYVSNGLWLLCNVGFLLQCEDRATALQFTSPQSTKALLSIKLPNSIAVRS